MDLDTIATYRRPTGRADVAPGPGEAVLAGGTWLYSEPQDHLTGLVDLTTLDWPEVEVTEAGVTLAATARLKTVADLPSHPLWPDGLGWIAAPLFRQCTEALLASFKVWNTATIGGNVCTSLPAGAMTSLCTALDAVAVVWTPDGGERREPVERFVTGVRRNTLGPGEVLRAIEIPAAALTGRTAFRKLALSPVGRSGTVVIGRRDPGGATMLSITASVEAPVVVRWPAPPTADEVAAAVAAVPAWYDDAHGAADWRAATTALLAQQVRAELELEGADPIDAPDAGRPDAGSPS